MFLPPEYKPEKYKSRNKAIAGRNTNTPIGKSNDHTLENKKTHISTQDHIEMGRNPTLTPAKKWSNPFGEKLTSNIYSKEHRDQF